MSNKKYILIFFFVGFLVFANALFNNFVWDDKVFIIGNPDLYSFNVLKLFGKNYFNYGSYYKPISAIYFSTLYTLFGQNAFYYHLFQLVLHILSVYLVFIIFRKFMKEKISFFLSLIFLVHPMNVESVSYISSSVSEVYFVFGAIAFLKAVKDNPKITSLIFIYLFILLSLFTKETGIVFLLLILIYRFIFNRIKFLYFCLASFMTLAIYIFVRWLLHGFELINVYSIPIMRLSFWERMINVPAVLFYYLKTFFFPITLSVDQLWIVTKINLTNFYLPLFVLFFFFSVLFYFTVRLHLVDTHKSKKLIFFLIWFLVGILPYTQIVALDMTVADRWFYFAMVGLIGTLGILAEKLSIRFNRIFFSSLIIILILFGLRTIIRNSNWQTASTLFSHDIKIEDNYDIENALGAELILDGKYKEAKTYLEKSVATLPYETNLTNLGIAYQKLGDLESARNIYEKALGAKNYNLDTSHKHYELTYANLAEILIVQGNDNKARNLTKAAVSDYPDSVRLWLYLAISEYKLGNKKIRL